MATIAPTSKKNTSTQFVFPYGQDVEPPPLDKNLLGGKGKGLAEMASIGLPIPPGFIITTEGCNAYRKNNRHFPDGFQQEVHAALKNLEKRMGKEFGSETDPLLVSVRSGSRVSMPGMMDTILNLGLTERSIIGFIESTKNERLAYDSYRRLIMMYANIVHDVSRKHFEKTFDVLKIGEGIERDYELSIPALKEACNLFKQIYEKEVGAPFPQDAHEQLFEAIAAVFDSWDCERATLYRKLHHYPEDWGTAVNIVTMVFGNKNANSATGVGFTRDPGSGTNHFFGEFLLNAQGEEVVAGIRTP
ncbi:MAG: PEP/pyruvate-binding domain-containing protein, partial [Waddliaceae bacterium]